MISAESTPCFSPLSLLADLQCKLLPHPRRIIGLVPLWIHIEFPSRLIESITELAPESHLAPALLERLRFDHLVIRKTKAPEPSAARKGLEFRKIDNGSAVDGDETESGEAELGVWGWIGDKPHEDAARAAGVRGELDVDGLDEGRAQIAEGDYGDGAHETN